MDRGLVIKPLPTGEKTRVGRAIFVDPRSKERYSERSVTFETQDGKWVTMPTVLADGRQIPQNIVERYVAENGPIDFLTGEKLPVFEGVREAEEYARSRSDTLVEKKQNGGSVYNQGIGRVVYKLQNGGSPPEDPNKRRNLPTVQDRKRLQRPKIDFGSILKTGGRVLTRLNPLFDLLQSKELADATLPQKERGVKAIGKSWDERNIKNFISEDKDTITLSQIEVPKSERKKGVGSQAMRELIDYADQTNKQIRVTPDTSFGGTSKDRLRKFYKRFGFVENKGRNKDLSISDSMYRDPYSYNIRYGDSGVGSYLKPEEAASKKEVIDTSYRLQHQARGLEEEGTVRLDNLTKDTLGNRAGYPEDFYSPRGQRIYAPGAKFSGDEYGIANTESYNEILRAKGNPEAEVTIYRAVPNEESITEINEGDFVTLSPRYAELHGASGYGEKGEDAGKLLSKKVKVKDLIWDQNDVNEFGYSPVKYNKGGSVYKQGIGTLAAFAPLRRKIIKEGTEEEIKNLRRTDLPNILIDQQGERVISPPGYNPETGEKAEFISDINTRNQGTLRLIKPPVYGKAEVGAEYMPIAQIIKNVPAGAKKTGQYIYDFLSDPETRTKAGGNVIKVLDSINKKAEAILYGQGDLFNNPGADYIVYEDGTRLGKGDLADLLLNFLGTGVTGSVIGGAGTAKAGLGDTTFYSYIGGRFMSNVPDNLKVGNTTGKKLKANLNEARIESNRINNLSRLQITEELRNLGFKSQKSISPALQRKLLEEYKIRKTYGWHIGPDNKIRYEVSDQNVRLDKKAANLLVKNPGDYVKTEDIFKGTPVFKMYPDLKGTRVTYDPNLPTFGQYVTEGGSKTISVAINPNKHPETFKNILIHEVGHDVQDHMLFASGGNRNIASDLNERLGAIRESMNTLEVRSSLGTLGPQDRSTLARLTADEGVLNGVLKNWNGLNLELKQAFAIEDTGLNFSSKNAKIYDLKNKIDLEETNLYRALSGEVYSRLDQRRAGLSPKERRNLSPDIPINQMRIQELKDQGYEVEDLSFDANPNKKINLIVRPRDGSNSLPPHVKKLKKEIEDTAKVERIAMNRKTPLDEEQDRVRKELDALTKEYYDFGVDVSSKVNKEKKRLIEELKKVIRVGETINLPRDRTKGLGRDKENLFTDMYSSDTPVDDVITKEPYFNSYRYQAMDGSSNIDKQTLIKNQEKRAEANVSLYKEREEIGKQSGLQKNAEEIKKAKDENALGPLAALLRKRNEIIKKDYPPTVFTEDNFPMLPLYQRAQNALDKIKREKIIDTGVDQLNENKSTLSLKSGQKVDARLDIPSYERQGTWVPAIHPQKREPFPVGYPRTTQLRNVDFVQEGSSRKKALEVASGTKSKSPFATMTGNWVNHDSADLYRQAKKFLNDPDWTQIGYNPKRASYFYNTKTLKPVKNAEEVIQIGQLVLAKNVKYGKDIAKDFNRGGVVSRETRPTVFSTGIPTALRRETNAKF